MSEPCVKSDKIDRLENDVVSINERLNRHSEKIDKISDNNLVLETILTRLEEDSKIQKEVNSEMQKTLLAVQGAMTEITFNIKGMNERLASTDDKLESTIKKVTEIDNKGKFDFISFVKNTVIPVVLSAGVTYYIINLIK